MAAAEPPSREQLLVKAGTVKASIDAVFSLASSLTERSLQLHRDAVVSLNMTTIPALTDAELNERLENLVTEFEGLMHQSRALSQAATALAGYL